MRKNSPLFEVTQDSLRAIARAETTTPLSRQERVIVLHTMLEAALASHPALEKYILSESTAETSSFARKLDVVQEDIENFLADFIHDGIMKSSTRHCTLELFNVLQSVISNPLYANSDHKLLSVQGIINAALDFEQSASPLNPQAKIPRYDANPFTALTVMNESLMYILPQIWDRHSGVIEKASCAGWVGKANDRLRSAFYKAKPNVESATAKEINFACDRLAVFAEYALKITKAAPMSSPLFTTLRVLRDYVAPYSNAQTKPIHAENSVADNVVYVRFGESRALTPAG